MKYLSWIITVILISPALLLILMNMESYSDIRIINPQTAQVLNIIPVFSRINTAVLFALLTISGALSVLFGLLPVILKNKEKENAFERKLEKTSVSNNESAAKVKVLENKIQVLEKALNNAVRKQQ